jgi:uncharacterized protein with NRDE domain
VAGLDELGGGSWFGLNDAGIAAGILNRHGTLGPAQGKRSRGELVLEALEHAQAETAAEALSDLHPDSYRAFNLVVVDRDGGYWLRHVGTPIRRKVEVTQLRPGLSMITAHDLNDESSARIRRYLPRFREAAVPDPEHDDWSAWTAVLASREADADEMREGAMNVVTNVGFGTVSSFVLALPSRARFEVQPRFRFAAGRPDLAAFEAVRL